MATKSIAWNDGSGDYITLNYTGQGDGTVIIHSDENPTDEARSMTVTIATTAGSPVITRGLTVTQGACPVPIGTVLDYTYTGSYQEVTLPVGQYKLECWGAQGGSIVTYYGGKGGYSVGKLTLSKSTTVYVYVGGNGTNADNEVGIKRGGFNGGGSGYYPTISYRSCGGGGASDVRIGQKSLFARIIVAGGGGGAGSYASSKQCGGGNGGGNTGSTGSYYNSVKPGGDGGSQTSGGQSYGNYGSLADFGIGAGANRGQSVAGGGGGWYGGGSAERAGGGGGSGYVYTSSTASNYPSGCLLDSSHYLTDAKLIGGWESMPSVGGNTETGHEGNGYIRITRLA